MTLDIANPTDLLGLTLAEYAAALGKHPQALRPQYTALMRRGEGITLPEPTRVQHDGEVTKFCLPAGQALGQSPAAASLETESVIIPMKSYRGTQWFTLCISSQVGCRMGCTFCETGRMGLLKNLSPGEIVRQRLAAMKLLEASPPSSPSTTDVSAPPNVSPGGRRYFADGIQNIVFMGMGEPLDNFDNVVQAIRVFNEPTGMNFPHTQITVSTVGRIDGIRKLAALGWINLRLAISLNAAHDALRNELMPINKGMPLSALKQALLEYPLPKKGRFLVEYVLIKGVNDSLADAGAVADWVAGLPCTVNLIPYNPQRGQGLAGAGYQTPGEETVLAFLFALRGRGVFVKRRVTHGRDLMGACGQLGNPEVRRKSAKSMGASVPGKTD